MYAYLKLLVVQVGLPQSVGHPRIVLIATGSVAAVKVLRLNEGSLRPYFKAVLRLYQGTIKALSRLYSGSIQALFRLYSGSIQALLRLC